MTMPSDPCSRGPMVRAVTAFMAVGQFGLILSTLLHAGGDANDHHAIFVTYAHDARWGGVHLGQFIGMAILLGGLLCLSLASQENSPTGRITAHLSASMAIVALALYGALQAADGIALKHAVDAWVSAPETERASRFASAEAIRWLEWGMRSYSDIAIGIALLTGATTLLTSARIYKAVALLMATSAVTYFIQGWFAGSAGFSAGQSIAIVVGWILNLIWMAGLIMSGRFKA